MIAELEAVLGWSRELLWTGFVVLMRVGAIMALTPAFGEQSIPTRVRLALSFAFVLIVMPAVADQIPAPPNSASALTSFALAEVVAGLLFGIILRFFIIALLMAGTIIAQSTSLSQLFGASAATEPMPAVGHLLVSGGLALATLLGLHVQAAAYMIGSYRLIPPGQWPMSEQVLASGLQEAARSLHLAFGLSMPFVIGALLYNLLLGVINRAMPQFMVTFVGAPALTAGGLALVFLTAPLLLSHWSGVLIEFMTKPLGMLQ
jgi:flagellar biosynthesis protein FliR